MPVLREISPTLAHNLDALPSSVRDALAAPPGTVRFDEGHPASSAVRVRDGRWVQVHESADPVAACLPLADQLNGSGAPLLVVIGLGLGYLLDALEQQGSTIRVLAVEPVPAISRAMLQRRDWREWLTSGRLTLLVGPAYAGSTDAWRLLTDTASTPPTIASPMLEREFGRAVAEAKSLVAKIVAGARANATARELFAGPYLMNTLANLPVIGAEGDAASLDGMAAGVPGIVVGAGPSLDRTLESLSRTKGRALIIAVDTAVRPLLAAGIRPHVVVTLDPSPANARHLNDLPDTRGMWLVAEPSVDPSVFPQFAGRTFTFRVGDHHPWPWLVEQGLERGILQAWGSVITTAFDLACRAGCHPVVFAGADLAYTDGAPYCRNTIYETEWSAFSTPAQLADAYRDHLRQKPHLTLADVRGHEVLTTPHFVQFRDWLVAESRVVGPNRVVNASGAGILQGGHISLAALDSLALPEGAARAAVDQLPTLWAQSRAVQLPNLQNASPRSSAAPPIEPWVEFAGDAISHDAVLTRFAEASCEVGVLSKASASLVRERAYFDEQASTYAGACEAIHPDFEHARQQAAAHQAHALMDLLQRTYQIEPSAGIHEMLRSAANAPAGVRILDFGCGVGRGMAPLADAGCQVDGVDFSERMLALARECPSLSASRFFLSSGVDCGAAPDGHYDLVLSHLCFSRITSRATRQRILQAMTRASRPGGVVLVQMHFYPDVRAEQLPAPFVSWGADDFSQVEGPVRRGVLVTPDELPLVLEDFSRHLRDLRLQFVDVPGDSTAVGSTPIHPFRHLVISGATEIGLASRMYAPLVKLQSE